jgi:lauroyl/myristoyl acyltransferase
MVAYLAFRCAAFLARHLPRRLGLAVMHWLGTGIYHVSPLAEAVRDNIRHVLGPGADPKVVSHYAKRSFQGQLRNYYEMMWLSIQSLQAAGWEARFDGLESVTKLASERRGMVLVAGHIGPMEYLAQGIASLGYDVFAVFEHLDNERLLEYLIELRSAHGLQIMSTKGPLIDAYRRIKRGEALLTAMDRDSTDTGRIVELFGAPAWMPEGYARVAVGANVPVVFAYGRYTENGPEGKLFPPIFPDRSLSKADAVTDLINKTLRLLEDAIREDPGAWHLTTPVWTVAQERMEAGKSN